MDTERIAAIFSGLNEEQQRAVEATEGFVLIIAGAGSGKTRVLTSRCAYLIEKGVKPRNILALTFTRKAAGEMRDRIGQLVGPERAREIVMGTFHSVFVRFLRQHANRIGFTPNFTILDTDAAESCLKDCIGEVILGRGWNDKDKLKYLSSEEKEYRRTVLGENKTKDYASKISLQKNNSNLPGELLTDYQNEGNRKLDREEAVSYERFLRIYRLYMDRCRETNCMDFDDILVYMEKLLKENKDVAQAIAEQFRYILIDEYQDTNAIQYEIISCIGSRYNNICVVGDDSQSIYAFRGARIQHMLEFKDRFPGTRMFKLESNYRSTPTIVEAANNLIGHNFGRIPKKCHAVNPDGAPIVWKTLKDDRSEAQFIAKNIAARHAAGASYSDFAVLYRMNAQQRAIEEAMIKARIPYTIWSGMSFFDRQEIKDTLSYARLIVNPNDNESFKRICNRPARGISNQTLTTLQEFAFRNNLTLYESLGKVNGYSVHLPRQAFEALKNFKGLIDSLRNNITGDDAMEAMTKIIKASKILEFYENLKDAEDGAKRSNNIKELVSGIHFFILDQEENGEGNPATSLSDWLDNITLLTSVDEVKTDADSVAIMTSHCSKGLEFPIVYVAGVEEGIYPCIHSEGKESVAPKEDQLEEERRIFYVTITRAKEELILLNCTERWIFGQRKETASSRFLAEMDTDFSDTMTRSAPKDKARKSERKVGRKRSRKRSADPTEEIEEKEKTYRYGSATITYLNHSDQRDEDEFNELRYDDEDDDDLTLF